MTVVFYVGLIRDDVYRLVADRFGVLGYATGALSVFRGKSLTEEEKGEIRAVLYGGMTERQIALKINKFKTVVQNFLYDPMSFVINKRNGRLSKLSARREQNVIRMAVRDCAYSFTIKCSLKISITSKTVRNALKNAECLNYAKLKAKTNL